MSSYSLRRLAIFRMLLIGTVAAVALYSISFAMSGNNFTILAQQDLETKKYRNMVIDLGDGVKTRAQLTLPAVGKGPFPGVLLIHGSGPADMNETESSSKVFWQISEYLSERGFAVLRYDKRGIGEGGTVINTSIWGNMTINDLIEDSKKALNVLMQQPEVDPKRISLVGHSEGTIIAPRVAIDNSTNVKNIVLMGVAAQKALDLEYYQDVLAPVKYAHQVVDENHTGLISVQQIAKDLTLLNSLYKFNSGSYIYNILSSLSGKYPTPSETEAISGVLAKDFDTNSFISIDKQFKPALMKAYENHTSNMTSLECNQSECARWFQSYANLIPPLSVIGNVSNSTGILMLNGENDSQTPVEQAFLFQQRLTDVKHPDHTLITYPDLGHLFYPSPQTSTLSGPIPQYVLADLYSWLESHSGLSHPYITTSTSTLGANTTFSGKR
jgi:pimeloyl-ACP methyl ester carboxylesterase